MKLHGTLRYPLFLVTLCSLTLVVGCKRSHDEAKQVKRVEGELNTPKVSAEQKKSSDVRLDWNMETLSDAYEKVGSRNPKWDTYARDALKLFAQVRAYGKDVQGFPGVLSAKVSRAVELGCDDPMIKYLKVRFATDMSDFSKEQVAQAFGDAATSLEASQYPDIRKFYAHLRAAFAYYELRPYPQEGYASRDGASRHLYEVLRDQKTPIGEVDEAGHEFLGMIRRWDDEKARYDPMEELLLKNWPKSGATFAIRGQYWIDYAWTGRTSQVAKKVTKEQWRSFKERLAETENILKKGMEIDPKEGRLPALMIKVVSGQNKGLSEMKHWWEKAMEADPNSYAACDSLLYFLLPRWYGSREAMVAFGRDCYNSDKFGGTVPLMLAEAHDMYNRFDGAPDGSYWKEPDVWPDIKDSFEKFFRLNPKAVSWRHNYARYAYWCEQWETLQEQLQLMGDDINYDYFGGRADFDKMVKLAKSHTEPAK